jgi:COMPASS component SPP1
VILFWFFAEQLLIRWQTVRYKDVCKEREKKEEALAKLTTRERELRKRIEDMLDPQNQASGETTSRSTVKNANPNVELARQFLKRKYKGSERGKKRKAPTS